MIRRSQIFRGKVVHERMGPRRHKFSYPMTFFSFELGELSQISENACVFGYNKMRPLRINDSDYLQGSSKPILEQLDTILPKEEPGQHTLLISSPRYFGYAFNPVNFHLRMKGNLLLFAVAEVNNTYGDRHVYALKELQKTGDNTWTACSPKEFHVSPFNDISGIYNFSFHITDDDIFLGVDLYKEGCCIMKTWLEGKARKLSNFNILRYAFMHPFSTAFNSMPRILWQAAVLYYRKRMKIYSRPKPNSENTLIDRDLN